MLVALIVKLEPGALAMIHASQFSESACIAASARFPFCTTYHVLWSPKDLSKYSRGFKLRGRIAFLGEFDPYHRSKRFDAPSCRPNVHFEWFTHMHMVLTLIMSPNVYTIIGIRHRAVCLMVSVSLVVVYHTSVAELFRDAIHVHCIL
jgi:hypothetical protein